MDISYLLWLQGIRETVDGALDGLIEGVSFLGDATVPLLLACLVYWCFDKRAGLFAMLGFNIGTFLNGVMKLSFCVYRPWVRDARVTPVAGTLEGATGYSFPSGHSTNAAAIYGGLGWQYRKRALLHVPLMALGLMILLSRNFAGVHTPQDVLVGAAVGAVALCLSGWLMRWADEGSNRDLWAALAGLALAAAALVYVSVKAYPMDYANGALLVDPVSMQPDTYAGVGAMTGMLWGWVVERRYARFTTQASAVQKLLRFVTGALVMAVIFFLAKKGLKALLGNNWGYLVTSLLAVFYAAGLHPVLFTRVERRFARGAQAADKIVS